MSTEDHDGHSARSTARTEDLAMTISDDPASPACCAQPYRLLTAILCLGIGLRLFYFIGVGGHDDISYFNHALEINDATFNTAYAPGGSFPFRFRVGLIYPTAWMFRLFGPSEYTAAILPLLNSAGLILLSWWAGRRLNESTGTIAALLMATFPLDIIQATVLLPTPFCAMLTGLSVMLWLTGQDREQLDGRLTTAVVWRYVLSGLCLGTAYLFRIEAGLFALFFVCWFLVHRRSLAGIIIALGTSAVVVGIENLVYWNLHGELLYRLKAVSGGFAEINSDLSEAISSKKSPMEYIRAIFFKPVELGVHWVLILPAAAVSFFARGRRRTALLLWFWPVALYLFFGSWSLSQYVPTTKNPRYLMNVSVPGLVLLAGVLSDLIQRHGNLKRLGHIALAGTIAGSLLLLNLAWIYRWENAGGCRIAADFIRQEAAAGHQEASQPIFAEHYSALILKCFLPERDVRAVSIHDRSIGQNGATMSADEITDGIVVVDEFIIDKYAMDTGMIAPDYLRTPPIHWRRVYSAPHPQDRFAYPAVRILNLFVGRFMKGPERSLQTTPVTVYTVTRSEAVTTFSDVRN